MKPLIHNHDFEHVLDRLALACEAHPHDRVSVRDVMRAIGSQSFGPLLLVPGLIGLSPIGAIPGIPGVMAVIVIFVAVQILAGRDHAWFPDFLACRSMATARLKRAVDTIQPYARMIDNFLSPRLTVLTKGVFFYILAALCLLVAVIQPVIELVPLAGIIPNAAIVAFGLAITAHDGLWALAAFCFTGASIYLIAMAF